MYSFSGVNARVMESSCMTLPRIAPRLWLLVLEVACQSYEGMPLRPGIEAGLCCEWCHRCVCDSAQHCYQAAVSGLSMASQDDRGMFVFVGIEAGLCCE